MPNLNGHQFIPITQLRSMKANDFASDQYPAQHLSLRTTLTGEQPEHRDITVGQLTRDHPIYQYQANKFDWDRLSHDVADKGLQHPLHVGLDPAGASGEERLLNGHHRAIMAMEQGHMFVPVSSNPQGNGPGNEGNAGYRKVTPKRPSRTWEPMIQEHEQETDQARWRKTAAGNPQHYGQGVLFNDKRQA